MNGSHGRTGLATVRRETLAPQIQVQGTLGYAGSYSVVNEAQGTVTSLPAVGQVVGNGQVLYEVSGVPIVLLLGSVPAYRSMVPGLSGPDVDELNADLVSLGDATSTEIPSGTAQFSSWTEAGVEKLQRALGVPVSGTLPLGDTVFLPTAARVTSLGLGLGAPAQPGQPVLAATSTTPQVSIALDAADRSEAKAGDRVAITLPDNRTTPGVISSVGTVATIAASSASGTGASGPASITVLVTPTDSAATRTWDQAPVTVTITTGSAINAMVVPVVALLAMPGGGYAVEVAGADNARRLVPVTLGLFDDAEGLVQVRGVHVAAGQHVVVPRV